MTSVLSERSFTPVQHPGHNGMSGDNLRCVDSQGALLAARLAAGDEEALTEIFERYGRLVFGLSRRVTGDSSIAEDVTQEVFVALWSHPERFDEHRGSLRAFLGVQAHRRSLDAVRRDGRRTAREQRLLRMTPEADICGTSNDSLEAAAMADVVRAAIGRLPPEQRQAVELAFIDGLTYREVAEVLGLPEGTVKSRLRLAQSKLHTWLDRQLLEFA